MNRVVGAMGRNSVAGVYRGTKSGRFFPQMHKKRATRYPQDVKIPKRLTKKGIRTGMIMGRIRIIM